MLKARKSARRFWFILISVFFIANAVTVRPVQSGCAGGFNAIGSTETGEFIALPDPLGLLQVTSMPLISDNTLLQVNLKIENRMPTQERLADGFFSMTFSYIPAGGGGITEVAATANVNCSELLHNDSLTVSFAPANTIPVDSWDTIQCFLVFNGTIGNQTDMIIVKAFPPGDLLFNEEWDNGLTGNHAWYSSPNPPPPGMGTTFKDVSGGKLTMTTTKNTDSYTPPKTGYFTDLFVSLIDSNHPNGIPITADSHIQFKIDEMISSCNDATEGAHVLEFSFKTDDNQTLVIQYSATSLFIAYTPADNVQNANRSFNTGVIIVDNIHAVFQKDNIAVPDPLYLVDIGLLQQIWPQAAAKDMHMVVDAVRVVDQNVQ